MRASAGELLWPLGNERTITGGFADTRPDHFHGGVDIHTGPDHLPVMAPEDGWIERMQVIPPGYGHVLYYRLPDGRTAVFGHLDHFNPLLEKTLRDSQVVAGTCAVDLVFAAPSPDRVFKRGEVLAYTGHSGAGPAHFHYEIREGPVQTDPLLYYGPPDNQPPVIISVRWTTLSQFTPSSTGEQVYGAAGKSRKAVAARNSSVIAATEPVAFFLQAYDPGPWDRNATPYIIRVKVNGLPLYEDTCARIDLLGPRNIYAKTVFGFQGGKHLDLWRLFNVPAPFDYADSVRDGRGWLRNLDHADVVIEVVDRAGNITTARFNVTCGAWPAAPSTALPKELRAGEFCLDTKNDPMAAWAQLASIGPDEVYIGPAGICFGGKTKFCHCLKVAEHGQGAYLYQRNGSSMRALWLSLNEGGDTISCQILRGGTYGLGFDHNPPDWTPLSKGGRISYRLTDDLSGVDYTTIRCDVDGRTAIAEFEYEERGGDIWTQEPLARGSHDITFTAGDRAGNGCTWHETVMIR